MKQRLSLIYLGRLGLPLLVFPFTPNDLMTLLDTSRLWFASLQAVAAAAMGAFYLRREEA